MYGFCLSLSLRIGTLATLSQQGWNLAVLNVGVERPYKTNSPQLAPAVPSDDSSSTFWLPLVMTSRAEARCLPRCSLAKKIMWRFCFYKECLFVCLFVWCAAIYSQNKAHHDSVKDPCQAPLDWTPDSKGFIYFYRDWATHILSPCPTLQLPLHP